MRRRLLLTRSLVLQRHIISGGVTEPTFPMAAARPGLAFAPPAGPVQPVLTLCSVEEQQAEQAPHLRERERNQGGMHPPFAPSAVARVTARKACASRQRVMWRCHPCQVRTSY